MNAELDTLRVDATGFLNFYPYRAPHIMWFLGAGTSVSSGLPTAGTLTWEFKRALYCNAEHVSPARFPDLSDPHFQTTVQSFFDAQGGYPKLWSLDEYSFYFEKFLPDERDRRRFLDKQLQASAPAYGHFCLAAIHAVNQSKIIWTTNFDRLVEQAFQEKEIRDKLPRDLAVAGLDHPDKAQELLQDQRWPLLIKLHGDYQYHKLKNTVEELRRQDEILEQCLVRQCTHHGLAFVGYSGRDESVMKMLHQAIAVKDAFPHGLFWFIRMGTKPIREVVDLLHTARNNGIQAGVIEIGGFDELMSDLFLPHHESLPTIRDLVRNKRERCQPSTVTYGSSSRFPVLRTNALEIKSFPSSCTRFEANVGGTKQVKEITEAQPQRMVAARRKAGVIAFGTREELTDAFQNFNPTAFDRHPIESKRLRYDSAEFGLVYHSLIEGIARQTGLARSVTHRGRIVYVSSVDSLTSSEQQQLSRVIRTQAVRRSGKDGPFLHEGVFVSVEYCDKRLWLILEPTLVVTTDGVQPYREADRSQFGREDLVKRYNRQANDLLEFWVGLISRRCGAADRGRDWHVYFPSKEESEAVYQITSTTAFARQK